MNTEAFLLVTDHTHIRGIEYPIVNPLLINRPENITVLPKRACFSIVQLEDFNPAEVELSLKLMEEENIRRKEENEKPCRKEKYPIIDLKDPTALLNNLVMGLMSRRNSSLRRYIEGEDHEITVDKRFICEACSNTLGAITTFIPLISANNQ